MTDEPRLDFETALKELEGIVGELERGEPDLSRALACFAQGVQLLARCRHLLDEADQNVALLTGVDAAGNPITAPLDPSSGPG